MTQTDRENILRRIRGLHSKTIDSGCSEQEALAASELMGKLLEKYGQ